MTIVGEISSKVAIQENPHSPHIVIGPKSSLLTISNSIDLQTKQVGKSINFDMATSLLIIEMAGEATLWSRAHRSARFFHGKRLMNFYLTTN